MILPSRALTADETREMLGPILEGLAYIHEKDLVHGHVKPSNIMVVDEVVKLSSDGISSSANRAPTKANPYLPPETARGRQSPASDIWSLGVTLIEALTQHRPVQLSNGGVSVPASIPMPFRNIAENCLRLDPRQRPTIAEIQRQLNPPTTSAVVPVIEPKSVVKTPAPHSRFSAGIFLAIAVVLVAIIAGLWWYTHSGAPSSQAASQTAPAAPTSSGEPVTKSNGKVIQQVMPQISIGALRTVRGVIRVRLKVSVDASGIVGEVKTEIRGRSRYFAREAEDAAEQWKFEPALKNGSPIPSQWMIEFEFKKSGVQVSSARLP